MVSYRLTQVTCPRHEHGTQYCIRVPVRNVLSGLESMLPLRFRSRTRSEVRVMSAAWYDAPGALQLRRLAPVATVKDGV